MLSYRPRSRANRRFFKVPPQEEIQVKEFRSFPGVPGYLKLDELVKLALNVYNDRGNVESNEGRTNIEKGILERINAGQKISTQENVCGIEISADVLNYSFEHFTPHETREKSAFDHAIFLQNFDANVQGRFLKTFVYWVEDDDSFIHNGVKGNLSGGFRFRDTGKGLAYGFPITDREEYKTGKWVNETRANDFFDVDPEFIARSVVPQIYGGGTFSDSFDYVYFSFKDGKINSLSVRSFADK